MRRLAAGMMVVAGLSTAPFVAPLIVGPHSLLAARSASTPLVAAPDAARFLTQATFGPIDASIADVQASGYDDWITQQEAMPVSASHFAYIENRIAALKAAGSTANPTTVDFYNSFWQQAVTGPDQLRQRVKLALSEIFVVSFGRTGFDLRGAATYYDMLGDSAFSNYRTLLENVTLHPMMGVYLTYMGNTKELPKNGQHPDENYAREIQQLMSTGVYQLNLDGSVKADANGTPIPNYTPSDIQGLAKIFTGYSWYYSNPTKATFLVRSDPQATFRPMINYPDFHSTSEKTFLGVTIPASTTPDPDGDLKIALDTIFNQPSVGPFIGKQLIQRLVTSNPSPAYITRVATVFNDNGSGVRGDLAAVVRAILTDPEARDPTVVTSPTFGKLREPVVRLANWARAFNATSASGLWRVGDTTGALALNQAVLNAPSVFNFWRPGYSPPHTAIGNLNLVAPEFQAVDEVSVSGYLNMMRKAVGTGIGSNVGAVPDVRSRYTNELPLATDASGLVDRLNLLLFYGQMSANLHGQLVNAVNSIHIPTDPTKVNAALMNRVYLAIYLAFSSPEYLAQR
jgi:uncharacterized protein (DUF1800 family)